MHRLTSLQTWLIIFFLLAGFGFIFLAIEVYEKDIFSLDGSIAAWIHANRSPAVTRLAIAVTFLGSQKFLLPANVLLMAWLFFRHRYRSYAWKIAVMSVSSAGFLFAIKYLIKRPRPVSDITDAVVHYSFPSGHTFTSIVFFGIIMYLAYRYMHSYLKFLTICCSILFIFFISWSRLYLQVHYASDVLASYCLGIMWLIMAKWFLLESDEHPAARSGLSHGNE